MFLRTRPLGIACTLFTLFPVSPLVYAQQTSNTSTDAENTTMPEVRVVAGRESSSYSPLSSRGATRTSTPLREVPQSVRVVSSQLLEDIGATRLADTVNFVSGITRLNDFGGTWENRQELASERKFCLYRCPDRPG